MIRLRWIRISVLKTSVDHYAVNSTEKINYSIEFQVSFNVICLCCPYCVVNCTLDKHNVTHAQTIACTREFGSGDCKRELHLSVSLYFPSRQDYVSIKAGWIQVQLYAEKNYQLRPRRGIDGLTHYSLSFAHNRSLSVSRTTVCI